MTDTATPRTWSFRPPVQLGFHAELPVTCMRGCTLDHAQDREQHVFPQDIWCQRTGESLVLNLIEHGKAAEPFEVLRPSLDARPYAREAIAIQVTDDVWTEAMNPGEFAEFITGLAAHLDHLRDMHAALVEAVAEHEAGAR
jgi:hypothetical protein